MMTAITNTTCNFAPIYIGVHHVRLDFMELLEQSFYRRDAVNAAKLINSVKALKSLKMTSPVISNKMFKI